MKDAAIELLIYKPDPEHPLPEEQRGVVVNPRLRQRFKHFLPVGVYLEGSDLRYYFFDQCDKSPKIYSSWDDLKRDLPDELKNIFAENPKLFIMGHGNGGYYGLGNCHGPSEHLYDANFDRLLSGFEHALPEDHSEVSVTLEGCNTDSQLDAAANQQSKTFLERVSVNHPEITFGGTGPWDNQDAQTGFRSLTPQAPITSMAGNIWKAGNSVIFYQDHYQVAVRKSLFASTQTAKELKVNTIEYARAMLLGKDGGEELIAQIALNREVLTIQDLKKVIGFPELQLEEAHVMGFVEREKHTLSKEQERYLARVRDILDSAEPIEQLTDRDVLVLLLGLKEQSVFQGNEELLVRILDNKPLLNLAMVACGKVLIGGPNPGNDKVIDLLLAHGADINSVDAKGMTALHYATQNFYNYRKEPLHLINKLLECGASLEVQNKKGQTPIDTAKEHRKDGRVTASDKLLASLSYGNSPPTTIELRQSVGQVFQMSQHKADELLSLPNAKREYTKCREGALYIPGDVVEKLQVILHSAKGNDELLSAFESELSKVVKALESGCGTGEVFSSQDEFIPKRFEDAKQKIAPIMEVLAQMKHEVAASKVAAVEPDLQVDDHVRYSS